MVEDLYIIVLLGYYIDIVDGHLIPTLCGLEKYIFVSYCDSYIKSYPILDFVISFVDNNL